MTIRLFVRIDLPLVDDRTYRVATRRWWRREVREGRVVGEGAGQRRQQQLACLVEERHGAVTNHFVHQRFPLRRGARLAKFEIADLMAVGAGAHEVALDVLRRPGDERQEVAGRKLIGDVGHRRERKRRRCRPVLFSQIQSPIHVADALGAQLVGRRRQRWKVKGSINRGEDADAAMQNGVRGGDAHTAQGLELRIGHGAEQLQVRRGGNRGRRQRGRGRSRRRAATAARVTAASDQHRDAAHRAKHQPADRPFERQPCHTVEHRTSPELWMCRSTARRADMSNDDRSCLLT